MPKPIADKDTKPFWDGCAAGQFLVPTCRNCAAPRWPPGPMCPKCQSEQVQWIKAGGAAVLYSWTTVTHPVAEVLTTQVPYIIALVDLAEGVRVVANLVECSPAEVRAAMAVRLVFENQDGFGIPNFRPAV